jgi:hypothetical protein
MSKRVLRAADGEGFIRALYDDWRDVETEYQVKAICHLTCTSRRGVIQLYMAVYPMGTGVTGTPLASYTTEYPTVAVQSFEAALYQAMVRLERLVDTQAKWPMGKA